VRIGRTGLPAGYVVTLWGSAIAAALVAWAAKLAVPALHPILTAIVVLGPYGAVFFGVTWLLGVPEAARALARLSPERR